MNNQKGFAPIVIILIVVGILAVAGGVWYWQSQYGLFCAKVGQALTTRPDLPKLPLIGKYSCCKGLSMISAAPEAKYMEINGEYVSPLGSGIICSDCGNGICEQWEHKYNCPKDCVKDETANWKTYQNEEYGFEVKYPKDFAFELSKPTGIDTITFADKTKPTSFNPPQYATIDWIAIYSGQALTNERLLSIKAQQERWRRGESVKIGTEDAIKFLPMKEGESTLFLIRHGEIMVEIGMYLSQKHIDLSTFKFIK